MALPAVTLLHPLHRATGRERVRQWAILFVIGVLHLLAILWLAAQSATRVLPVEQISDLIDIASSPGGKTVVAVAPREPPEVVAPAVSPIVIARTPDAAVAAAPAVNGVKRAAGGGGGAGGCALGQTVGDAILADAQAMAELEALPPQARTKADAVMLWDGKWPAPSAAIVAPLGSTGPAGTLRQVVETAIASAPLECRDAMVAGPRFIALPGVVRTTMVVVGSGQWRWADLIEQNVTCGVGGASAEGQGATCTPDKPLPWVPKGTN